MRTRSIRRPVAATVAALAVLAAACDGGASSAGDATAADGWTVEEVRADLNGPTQLALGRDGETVYVAELNGDENAGTGRVLHLGEGGTADEPLVVVEGLTKPTGLAVPAPREVYVQEERDVVRIDLMDPVQVGTGTPRSERTTVVEGLPSNGRSQGTLTLLEDGRLLHTATGRGTTPDAPQESGVLYVTELTEDGAGEPEPVATGFKNAYAHTVDAAGTLWVTDVGDGRYDGEQVVEELNRIDGVDTADPYAGGWPLCTGLNDPVEEFGATAADCEDLPLPFATFAPRSTPTGLVALPDGRLLVALFTAAFVEGGVVEVSPDGEVRDVLTGVRNPQDLLLLEDGSVLLTVHTEGRLLRLVPG